MCLRRENIYHSIWREIQIATGSSTSAPQKNIQYNREHLMQVVTTMNSLLTVDYTRLLQGSLDTLLTV